MTTLESIRPRRIAIRHPDATARAALIAALFVTVLLWGSAFVLIRMSLPSLGWANLATARLELAAVAFGILAAVVGVRRPAAAELPLLAAIGALGSTAYQELLSAGEETVPAGTAALLFASAPVMATLLSGPLLGERLAPRGFAGLGLAIAGAVLVAASSGGGGSLGGAGLILCAAACYAGWVVLHKRALSRMRILDVTAWASWFGALFALPFGTHLPHAVTSAPASALIAVATLGLVCTTVPFLLWAWVLSRLDASRAAPCLLLISPAALLVAWLALGERPAPGALTGGALTLAGVAIAQSTSKASPAVTPRVARGRAASATRSPACGTSS